MNITKTLLAVFVAASLTGCGIAANQAAAKAEADKQAKAAAEYKLLMQKQLEKYNRLPKEEQQLLLNQCKEVRHFAYQVGQRAQLYPTNTDLDVFDAAIFELSSGQSESWQEWAKSWNEQCEPIGIDMYEWANKGGSSSAY